MPSGDYLLVLIDEHSRFPIVETVRHLTANAIIPVLDKIFATFGIPKQLKTDNGTPFNSHQFHSFANYLGFDHHRVTPRWPEANGEAERFMKNLGKALRTSESQGVPWKQGLNAFLRSYRSTPHASTQQAPAVVMFQRDINIKIPTWSKDAFDQIHETDKASKQKMKRYADARRHTKSSNLKVGDTVLVRQDKKNKLSTPYNLQPYVISDVQGTRIMANRNGHTITRNSSFFKKVPSDIGDSIQIDSDSDDDDFINPVPNPNTNVRVHRQANHVPQPQDYNPPIRNLPPRTKQKPIRFNDYV